MFEAVVFEAVVFEAVVFEAVVFEAVVFEAVVFDEASPSSELSPQAARSAALTSATISHRRVPFFICVVSLMSA
ncbi:MAG: hypothetical protein CMH57_07005 [Myxococcales bacterium]|nr:hypothetical protein [Myxococcales bacterium]